ncbi:MAG: hypothetical protein IKC94_04495 [Lentisphaeria bacterium]|nr:hypothetical protein [Lentisphaeria bacterium]
MKVFLNILVTALLMNMELICGNTGLALGLPLFGAVYFFIAFSPVHGITSAAFSALLLDAMYARNCLTWPLAAIVIVSAAGNFAGYLERRMPLSPLGSGGLCALLVSVYNVLNAWFSGVPAPGPDFFSMLVFQVSGGGLFMLLLVWLFDAVNFRCNLPQFHIIENGKHRFSGGRL